MLTLWHLISKSTIFYFHKAFSYHKFMSRIKNTISFLANSILMCMSQFHTKFLTVFQIGLLLGWTLLLLSFQLLDICLASLAIGFKLLLRVIQGFYYFYISIFIVFWHTDHVLTTSAIESMPQHYFVWYNLINDSWSCYFYIKVTAIS